MAKSKQEELATVLMDFYQKPVARVSLELILSVLAVIFFAIFAIRPTLLTMSDLVKEIEDKEELSEQLNVKLASLATAQQQYEMYQSQFYLLEEAIPRQIDIVKSLKKLEKLAGEGQLVIESISIRGVPDIVDDELLSDNFSDYKREFLILSINVIGDYAQIREFVEKIINLRQIITVNQVSVSKVTEKDALSASIRVLFPYYSLENGSK